MSKTGINNLAPKVISILFAFVLWIYVMSTINPKTSANFSSIPVNLMNVEELKDQELAIVGDQDFKVRVKLTGRRDEVSKVSADQIQVKADLRGYSLGTNNVPLEVTVPNNVEVEVSPRFIRVELEEIIKKQRNVNVIITGTPKENYIAAEPQYKPTVVMIEGPESYVNSVESVAATLDVSGESKPLVLSLPLKAVNSRGEEVKNVDVKTSYVDITLDIDLLKSVPIKANYEFEAAEGYKVTNVVINPSEVILKGSEDILKGITEITTKKIEVQNLNKAENLEVTLELPEGVVVQNETPITMDVYVEKIEEEIFKISRDQIIFSNLDENLKVDKKDIPETLAVKISALRTVLDTIKESDIRIEVDLANLNSNEYTIEPVIQLPFIIERDVESIQLDPKTINIKLVTK